MSSSFSSSFHPSPASPRTLRPSVASPRTDDKRGATFTFGGQRHDGPPVDERDVAVVRMIDDIRLELLREPKKKANFEKSIAHFCENGATRTRAAETSVGTLRPASIRRPQVSAVNRGLWNRGHSRS